MRYMIATLLLVSLLISGCSIRLPGKPYLGDSCEKSLMHYYAHCSNEKLTKEDFEAKVQACEKEFASQICAKQLANLLWCKGRVVKGTYSSTPGLYGGVSSTTDGCDCSVHEGELKKCRMKNGIFEK